MDTTTEIQRTRPDIVLFDPTGGEPPPWNDPDFFWLNEHLLVQPNGRGELLAMWTRERLKPWKWSVKYAHSRDGGATWSDATLLDGPKAAWQVPVISPETGRIYVFATHGFLYGGMRCHPSDDGGHTWSDPVELEFAKGPTDHPGMDKQASWISPTVPHWDSRGRPLIGFTRWATHPDYPVGVAGHSQVEYFRIENLSEKPAPENLRITWLNLDDSITAPHGVHQDASYAQEPYTVDLPDGRLLVVMRTDSGHIWYSVSSDAGETWRKAEPLLDRDGGEPLKNPVSPCPIFALERGDYVLLFCNNDGTGEGLKNPEDRAARRPAYLARGEFRPEAHQPIWFSEPKLFIDNGAVPWGPPGRERLEAATYLSLTEEAGRRILWYPDRKSFLLGKLIPDSMLDAMEVPADEMKDEVPGDWRRSDPLSAIYLPKASSKNDRCNQQVVGIVTKRGSYLVTWTMASEESREDQRIAISRSTDQGRKWSAANIIDGHDRHYPGAASYSWLFQTPGTGRIYCFYLKNDPSVITVRRDITGWLKWQYSDDDGVTWRRVDAKYDMGRGEWTSQDPSVPTSFIGIYAPHTTSWGDVLFSFARYGLKKQGDRGYGSWMTEAYLLHLDNIRTEPDPEKLTFSILPDSPRGLRIKRGNGMYWGNEPSWIELSDGRLMMAIRTRNDAVYFALSDDRARTWSNPKPLRYADDGEIVRNPNAPCPIIRLKDGRIVLMFYNAKQDGTFGPRNPVWIAVGGEDLDARQPVRFGEPVKFMEVDGKPPLGSTYVQIASYSSLVEHDSRLLLFYNDCKHWVLFKHVPESLLQSPGDSDD